MPSLIGNKPNQVPTNGDLGSLAYQDANAVKSLTVETETVTNQTVTNSTVTTQTVRNPQVDTEISDIRPTLLLDFAKSRSLDPRVTFTRASTATFYDGKTVAKAEENLFLRSQEFNDGIWGKNALSITADTTAAPDGTNTADTVTSDGTSAAHNLFYTTSTTLNGTFSFSIFVKAGTASFIQIRTGTDAAPWANFNVSTGALGTVNAGTTATITVVANGFYRCSISFSTTTAQAIAIGLVTSATAARNESNTLNTTVFIWGAQLEQRSSVTAYTPTTTQAITNYIPVLSTAAAGVPRFEHNPITGESLGLEIEEQRANLLLRSEDFADAAWTKARASVTANTIVAPDGTLTGDKLFEDTTASNSHFIEQSASITTGVTYSYSVFAKQAERTQIRVRSFMTGSASADFDLSTGTVSNPSGTVSQSITSVGNGWFRCTIVVSSATTGTGFFNVFLMSGGTNSYTGNGYAGLFIWGAQLEAGAFPTSYIPTVASQVTRNADVASMTGVNFSSWYRQDEGTIYVEHQKFGTINFQRVVGVSDGGFDNRIGIGYGSGSPNNISAFISTSAVSQASLAIVASSAINTSYKSAFAYAVNDFAAVANAGTVQTDASGTFPVVNRLNIGIGDNTSSNPLNGTIKKLAYYPRRLPNAELQEMTI